MGYITELLSRLHNLNELIVWGGYVALALIIFSETGLFFGFFLPGDSLLVTAGLFAAKGDLNVFVLLGVMSLCAIAGDAVGFEIGRFAGHRIVAGSDGRFIKREHIDRTRAFYEKNGGKTIILARFMPIVRTFAPLVAGMAGMTYAKFAAFNVIGGIAWVTATVGLGFTLGRVIPDIDKYITYVIIAVVFLSILPGIIEYGKSGHWKRWFEKKQA